MPPRLNACLHAVVVAGLLLHSCAQVPVACATQELKPAVAEWPADESALALGDDQPMSHEYEVSLYSELELDCLMIGVEFTNDGSVSIAVGGRDDEAEPGVILRTIDQGTAWKTIDSPSRARLYDIAYTHTKHPYAAGERVPVAVGLSGEILRSNDDGEA
ncbi:MAG: hypothetical protein ACI841_003341 [Planctomycetota bacterium]|jgi:hypothetical protein